MPTSSSCVAAVVDPLPLTRQILSSEYDDDVEMECEEVEEEIEVKEEVGWEAESAGKQKEKEKEDDEFGEDLTPIREENQQNDAGGDTGPEEQQNSGLVTSGEPVADLLPNILTSLDNAGKPIIGESREARTMVESGVDGQRTSKDNDQMVPVSDPWGLNALNPSSSIGLVNAAPSMVSGVKYFQEETNHNAQQGLENIKHTPPRLNVSQIRPRELWSGIDLAGVNKRQRVICEFYAKGWCIKGKSCRFLHIKEGAMDALKQKSQHLSGEASTANIAWQESGENPNSKAQDFILPMVKGGSSIYGNGSFQQNFSSYSITSYESHGNTGISCYGRGNSSDTQLISGYIYKSSADDWEPSVPFRPSHFITQKLLSQENIYDPIRDNVGPTNVKDGISKGSSGGEGASMKKPLQSTDDLHSTGDNVSKAKSSSNCDTGNHGEQRHKTELEVERVRYDNKIDLDFKTDVSMQKESKVMRHFQAVLIEYVKELVKPTWLSGLMSKGAHNLIVKKAVDKVLSTFEPHQIPSTSESIKLYLSVNEPKLKKLVEGYIDRHGNS